MFRPLVSIPEPQSRSDQRSCFGIRTDFAFSTNGWKLGAFNCHESADGQQGVELSYTQLTRLLNGLDLQTARRRRRYRRPSPKTRGDVAVPVIILQSGLFLFGSERVKQLALWMTPTFFLLTWLNASNSCWQLTGNPASLNNVLRKRNSRWQNSTAYWMRQPLRTKNCNKSTPRHWMNWRGTNAGRLVGGESVLPKAKDKVICLSWNPPVTNDDEESAKHAGGCHRSPRPSSSQEAEDRLGQAASSSP